MPTNVDTIIRKLSPAQRKKVEARAAQLIAEEMTLRELRHARKLTQVRMAKALGITQDSVSRRRRFLCTGGRHRFGPVLDSLGAMEAGGQTDFFAVLREFITRYSQ